MRKDKFIELILGSMFIILILIIVLLGTTSSEEPRSFNNFYTIDNSKTIYVKNTFVIEKESHLEKSESSITCKDRGINYTINYRDYNSLGSHKKSKDLGLYTDIYEVKIKNYGASQYFVIKFYLEESSGKDKIVEMRKYLSKGEEKRIYYQEINKNPDVYSNWKYDIIN